MKIREGFGLAAMLLSVAVAPAVLAQAAPATGTGMVSGHVTCGDTQRPARFASVILMGVPADVAPAPKLDPNGDQAAMMAAIKASMESLGKTNMVTAQTGMDGSYSAADVAPGDYYVFASVPGYVQPKNLVQAAVDAGADLHKGVPGVGVVHVVAEHTATADVTIDRGAAVSGTVSWDDGAPVAGVPVAVISTQKDEKQIPTQFALLAIGSGLSGLLAVTDDLGRFRISGLAAGDYLVQATLQANSGMNMQAGSMNLNKMMAQKPLIVFAPAAFHKADAKALTLKAGEDRREEDLTVNLAGTHTVSGRVASAEDHHGLNSATVRLVDTTDKDFTRSASVDAAGNYSVTFVPPGTYNLTVTDAADTETVKSKGKGVVSFADDHTLRSYEDAKGSVIVSDSDLTGQDVELTPSKTTKKDVNLEDMLPSTTE